MVRDHSSTADPRVGKWNPYFLSLTGADGKGDFTASIADGGLGGHLDRWYLCIGYIQFTMSLMGVTHLYSLHKCI